ncbi:orotidine-5'-phosphate decarboxylase [Dermatophilus congolensis]|uniref:orotidine-5'-phosphate decarboxylase n=1 Tax=Dermatophilus congolensis TaxID=1863 RepID=UPI001D7405FF|nr:orotidine-5'-phosphate decarboxylase [Dermatophilus congolensis]MBO3151422.1 orotidine-5'-phosphate decarboxylase [Dermatophilus congolensis]MBO3161574.1 orotidine-5'-phosphate decarboxylase [Dermatophilus congolensis]MBO3162708.1 orotidine-5'-phosphate decarboxylase [Dermatophilus congolensis]MBO3176262.1 orotidine-5'-phosphate decarboxylase [Dermatophilus congolensis]
MMSTTASFGVRLRAAMKQYGPLCVGIDPHPGLLEKWGLSDDVHGLEVFAATCVEAFGGYVAAVKPQSAFFERFGSAGVAVLEDTLAGLRQAGTLSILDVKRGDIGSTMAGYAQAYLGEQSSLRADAVTVSPYLGYESLRPALDLAEQTGRGVIVLALTSNPEGKSVQHASTADHSVAGAIVAGAAADNAAARDCGELGRVGLVVGATVGNAVTDLGIDLAAANAPILAPGIGAQGATGVDVQRVFGAACPNVLANSSRGVLSVGSDVKALRSKAIATAEELAETLRAQ